MKQILKKKLHRFLSTEHPDLLVALQEDQGVSAFIDQKVEGLTPLLEELYAKNAPGYIIQEKCMDALVGEFPPSRYSYLLHVLEEEFSDDYQKFQSAGILQWEVMNMLKDCAPAFDAYAFDHHNSESRELYYTVTGTLHEYLMQQSQENY
ncbi:DUF1896 family protein [Fontibacter flavus]|uniref:DUF1896 family protein n=1 Tax=Fontibacter flavus TaxID=654838 RepID=A0ABV6FV21_9BACT